MAKILIYFAKININSHIHKVYKSGNEEKYRILNLLSASMKNEVSYKKHLSWKDKEKDIVYEKDVEFKFSSLDRFDDTIIVGNVVRTTDLFVKQINPDDNSVNTIPVKNSEIIQFYFDSNKEIVAFYTTQRFKYREFEEVFEHLINECMAQEYKEKYYFEVSLLSEPTNFIDFQKQLKKQKGVEELRFEVVPPNANDEYINKVIENGEARLDELKEGNITKKSIVFTSKAPNGLNLSSNLFNKEFDEMNAVYQSLTDNDKTDKGYVRGLATLSNGKKVTTKDKGLYTRKTDEKNKSKGIFMEICKDFVSSLLS